MIKGSMCSPEISAQLETVRNILHANKLEKLKLRASRHPNDEVWIAELIVFHLYSEFIEFEKERIFSQNYSEMLKELADISNCVDALALMVIMKEPMI